MALKNPSVKDPLRILKAASRTAGTLTAAMIPGAFESASSTSSMVFGRAKQAKKNSKSTTAPIVINGNLKPPVYHTQNKIIGPSNTHWISLEMGSVLQTGTSSPYLIQCSPNGWSNDEPKTEKCL